MLRRTCLAQPKLQTCTATGGWPNNKKLCSWNSGIATRYSCTDKWSGTTPSTLMFLPLGNPGPIHQAQNQPDCLCLTCSRLQKHCCLCAQLAGGHNQVDANGQQHQHQTSPVVDSRKAGTAGESVMCAETRTCRCRRRVRRSYAG